VVVFDLSDVDAAWTVKTILPAQVSEGVVEATLARAGGTKPGKTYEVKVVELRSPGGTMATLIGGQDFPRTFFRTRAHPNEPKMTAEEVSAMAIEVEREREVRFNTPLGDPQAPEAAEFRVLMLVERLLLTNYMRVPGIELLPLSSGNPATDEAEIINRVLDEVGWNAGVNTAQWAEKSARERPIVLIRVPRLFATAHEHALWLVHRRRDRLLNLMALYRGSSGVPFATVVQKLVDAKNGRYAGARIYPEGKPYTGDIVGGGVSGEDSRALFTHDRAAEADPLLRLCVSLYREARTETNPDFAYFRYWSLLEVLATERIEAGSEVADFRGNPILVGGEPAKTSHARGRVYELLKRWMRKREYSEQSFTRPVSESLWEAVGIWNARRNATAHYGAFVVEDQRQQSQSWYRRALKSYDALVQHEGIDLVLFNLEDATNKVLQWELFAAAPRPSA
jgi:hypothetical protein